ncbi:MAG: hypothetical protein J5534_13420 [Fibrobacter sp.]|nr:hypothetical protein [Fibrobacter sp.]
MLNSCTNKLLLVICLLLSLNAFAQAKDSASVMDSAKVLSDVQDVDPAILLDSIDYYQNLIDETEYEAGNKLWGYLGIGLGSVSFVSGLYLLHGIAGTGGAGYAIGAGVLPAVLIVGGAGLTFAGCIVLSTTSKLPEKAAEYKERKAFFTERYDEVKLQYDQDSSSVNMAYIELLNDDTFKSLKKKAQCREKANISDFYQCVSDLYREASIWGFSLGGIHTTLGTAYVVSQKKFTVSTAIVIPLIGFGVYYIVYGGIFNSKANEYRAKAGH